MFVGVIVVVFVLFCFILFVCSIFSVLAHDLVCNIQYCRMFKGTTAAVEACTVAPTIMCVRYGSVPSQLQRVSVFLLGLCDFGHSGLAFCKCWANCLK